ncbi:MBL fold metallo-hydrolase [Christiangramia portivictoriae]|uniref:MBL fold metallo-hydrolase n=1 Tax=Christiangramia portivictoriae TaxID=326069 RepID=UPI0004081EA7|nr:MBL fold metallo-hydrolase [Christiangramia portivictoriae]
MKNLATLIAAGLILVGCKDQGQENESSKDTLAENSAEVNLPYDQDSLDLQIEPISHATAVFKWGDKTFYTDPVGGAEAFENKERPDFILITDIHGDHMNAETLMAIGIDSVTVIVPQAVKDKLPAELKANYVVLNNGESRDFMGINIKAIPMYNLPQSKDAMHVKGRGNGYVLERNGKRLYISGDTEDIPEMRNLENIDVALVSMNLPYTMPVDRAAKGVLAFKPRKVIPYHYRGKNGLSDVEEFKRLVNEENSKIEVELMDWYPERSK